MNDRQPTLNLSLRVATDSDFDFCESLSRLNMSAYREARGITWDRQRFRASWREFENLMLLADGEAVGVLRLLPEGQALAIRDLQLLPGVRGRGIGAWALEQAKTMARGRGFGWLVLRVYADNPARQLYLRHGFSVVDMVDATLHMACLLPPVEEDCPGAG